MSLNGWRNEARSTSTSQKAISSHFTVFSLFVKYESILRRSKSIPRERGSRGQWLQQCSLMTFQVVDNLSRPQARCSATPDFGEQRNVCGNIALEAELNSLCIRRAALRSRAIAGLLQAALLRPIRRPTLSGYICEFFVDDIISQFSRRTLL